MQSNISKKIVYYDTENKKETVRYIVKAKFPDGTEGASREVVSFDKMSCFELWQCPDVGISGKEQKYIRYKLQMESAGMEAEKCICCGSGFQWYQGQPIYVLGNKIAVCGKMTEKIIINTSDTFDDTGTYSDHKLCVSAVNIIKTLPGVSEIMFYYSLLAVIKPILHDAGIDTNYLLAVIGPSEHLKTSLSKKLFLWLSDKERQMSSFSSQCRTGRLLEAIDHSLGMCYLVDDYHIYSKTQDIDRQNKRLDDIVRHMEQCSCCANIVITGEYIDGIFSCIDRTLVVNITKMNKNELSELKIRMNNIPENFMAALVYSFVHKLLAHIEEVIEDCKDFYRKNCVDSSDQKNVTRTYRHCIFLCLAEVLYRKYMCGDSQELSCRDNLEEAIEVQYKMQQKQLQKISAFEQHDYILDMFDMLSGNNRYLTAVVDSSRYTDFDRMYFQKDDTIYVTRNALRYGMMNYYEKVVDINKIIRFLTDERILNISTDSLTKRFKGRRHYLISLKYLKAYMKYRDV